MSNYSILQQNTLAGLSEAGGCLYLTLLDVFQGHTKAGEHKALFAATRFDEQCGDVFDYILRNYFDELDELDEKTRQSISAFFAERYRHSFMDKPLP